MNAVQKLRSLHGEIVAARDGFKLVDAWTLAGRLLGRMPVDQAEARRVCGDRDPAGLDELLRVLEAPAPEPTEEPVTFSTEEMESAMGAFKRRLRIVRLNDESRLGGRYTSSGRRSGIDAIEPPREFDRKIWAALVRAERLRKAGGGMYSLGLTEPPPTE